MLVGAAPLQTYIRTRVHQSLFNPPSFLSVQRERESRDTVIPRLTAGNKASPSPHPHTIWTGPTTRLSEE